ncbi:hypothetical protein [Pontibacter sp. SGAir0037]|uniref:hypothetical protein n=1 Tax=Pontibacter sp. SGAir0037 TaxID=2571030 RepID=UPI0010CD4C6D|nr:hypothetical protein [Pontibacter sp. SGAir0037]QCR22847.1 hypothetical protein C1N53_11170 [Pontibacter sp. SGAir0037]
MKENSEPLVSIIKQQLWQSGGVVTDEIRILIDEDIESNPWKYDSFDEIEGYASWLEDLPIDPLEYHFQPEIKLKCGGALIAFEDLYMYAFREDSSGYENIRYWVYKHIRTGEMFEVAGCYDIYDEFESSRVRRVSSTDNDLLELGYLPDTTGYNKVSRKYRLAFLL